MAAGVDADLASGAAAPCAADTAPAVASVVPQTAVAFGSLLDAVVQPAGLVAELHSAVVAAAPAPFAPVHVAEPSVAGTVAGAALALGAAVLMKPSGCPGRPVCRASVYPRPCH